MPRYAFTFKKDDIFVEFVTSDKDVVERQFQIWVADADDYASKHIKKNVKKQASSPVQEKSAEQVVEAPVEETKIVESSSFEPQAIVNEAPVDAVAEPPIESIIEPVMEPQVEQVVQPVVESAQVAPVETQVASEPALKAEPQPDSSFIGFKIEQETQVEETQITETPQSPEVFDNASNLLRTINTIQNPTQDDKQVETVNFEDVLEKSIENPTFEPATGNKDQVFLNLIRSKNTNDKFHALMITSYYLSEFEKRERFTLKQINSKLMQNLSMAIDHTTLQEAINQQFIELVPDLTGTSEVGEYRLTNLGEEFFAKI